MSKKVGIRDRMNPMKRSQSTSKIDSITQASTKLTGNNSKISKTTTSLSTRSKRETNPNFKIYRGNSAGNKRESIERSQDSKTNSKNTTTTTTLISTTKRLDSQKNTKKPQIPIPKSTSSPSNRGRDRSPTGNSQLRVRFAESDPQELSYVNYDEGLSQDQILNNDSSLEKSYQNEDSSLQNINTSQQSMTGGSGSDVLSSKPQGPSMLQQQDLSQLKEDEMKKWQQKGNELPFLDFQQYATTPEMSEFVNIITQRFQRLQQRIETNESLIQLQEESLKLSHLEKISTQSHEDKMIQELNARVHRADQQMQNINSDMNHQRSDLEKKFQGFERNVDDYLSKFVKNAVDLCNKFDDMKDQKDKNNSTVNSKNEELEKELDQFSQELTEKINAIDSTIGSVEKVNEKAFEDLATEDECTKNLENDFLKLLDSYREFNEKTGEIKWITDEITSLKNRQMQILSYLNFNIQGNNSMMSPGDSQLGGGNGLAGFGGGGQFGGN